MPKGSGPIVGNFKQLIVIKPDQRTFQNFGQCQIVLGHQKEPTKRHQVHYRQLIGDLHPVNTGHRHIAFLKRLDHFIDKGGPAAHQNHEVTGPHRTPA